MRTHLNGKERRLAKAFVDRVVTESTMGGDKRLRDVDVRIVSNGLGEMKWVVGWYHRGRWSWLTYSGYGDLFMWADGDAAGGRLGSWHSPLAKFDMLKHAQARGRAEAAKVLMKDWKVVS